jgi:transposase InsO family protein
LLVPRATSTIEVLQRPLESAQYTSLLFCGRAYDEQVRLSFGRVGTAADNAAIEAFWSTLKRELRHLHGRRVWPDRNSLRAALFDYIEIFYNRERHQARLAHRTPVEYEQREIEIRV